MKKFGMIVSGLLLSVSLFTPIMASAKSKAMAALKCPSCGMPMPTHKTAMMSVPINVKGTTYYCCPMCPSGKKAAAYWKAHHKAMSV